MRSSIQLFRRHGLRGTALALLLLLLPLPATAEEPVSFCFNNWPPYSLMNDSGPSGITVDIVKRAAQLIGRRIRFVEREWSKCLEMVKNGEFDALLDAAKRDTYLQGPRTFSSYTDTLWVGNDGKISRYDQLKGGRIGLVEGYNYGASLVALLQTLDTRILRGKDDPTNLRNLAQGGLDAAVADLASTFAFSREYNLPVHPILPPFSVDLLYPSFNLDRVEIQREFDRAFARLLEQGGVDDIYVEYIGAPYSSFSTSL